MPKLVSLSLLLLHHASGADDVPGSGISDNSDMLQLGMNSSHPGDPHTNMSVMKTSKNHHEHEHSSKSAGLLVHEGGKVRLRTNVKAIECSTQTCQYKVDCPDRLFKILTTTDDMLKKLKLPYYIMAGTLLGAVRDQGILSQTADIDIAMHSADIAKLLQVSVGSSMNYGRDDFANMFRGCDRKTGGSARSFRWEDTTEPYIDIYPIETWGDFLPYKSLMTGSQTATIRGRQFPVPSDPEYVICGLYGHDWKQPHTEAHGLESYDHSLSSCPRKAGSSQLSVRNNSKAGSSHLHKQLKTLAKKHRHHHMHKHA